MRQNYYSAIVLARGLVLWVVDVVAAVVVVVLEGMVVDAVVAGLLVVTVMVVVAAVVVLEGMVVEAIVAGLLVVTIMVVVVAAAADALIIIIIHWKVNYLLFNSVANPVKKFFIHLHLFSRTNSYSRPAQFFSHFLPNFLKEHY
jgi:hypothetical protein